MTIITEKPLSQVLDMSNIEKTASEIEKNLKHLSLSIKKMGAVVKDAKIIGDKNLISHVEKNYNNMKQAHTNATKRLIRLRTSSAVAASKELLGQKEVAKPSYIPAIVLASIISVAAIGATIIYKKYLSQGAKACKDKKGIDKNNCMKQFKISGYKAAINLLKSESSRCKNTKNPELCKSKIQQKINKYTSKIQKETHKLKEDINAMEPLIESYINFLYDPEYQVSKEIQGPNIPVEQDNKPNWIRDCMLLQVNTEQINCLRRLKEMTAMNPFYQYRIDRFIDAITQTYEPTDEPGTVPGSELNDI